MWRSDEQFHSSRQTASYIKTWQFSGQVFAF